MRHGAWMCILAVACGDEPMTGDDEGPPDSDVPTSESATDTGTPETGPACFADWTYDGGDDGSLDGEGIDVYDEVRTDKIVYSSQAFYGFAPNSTYYTYDTDWNLVLYEFDAGDNGIMDYVATYVWDEAGNIVHYEVDSDGDGDIDNVQTYTWTDGGEVSSFEWDQDGDGDLDYAVSFTHDEEDKRLQAFEDLDGDGATDIWFTYAYDAIGRPASTTGDAGNDGSIELLRTLTYTDPVLRIGSSTIESTIDEYPSGSSVFEHDAQERLLFGEEDIGTDGVVDTRYTAVYDELTGLVVDEEEYEFDRETESTFSIHTEYQFDALLRLVDELREGFLIEDDEQSDFLVRETYTFGGTCP